MREHTVNPTKHREWAQALFTARAQGVPIEPLTDTDSALTVEDAYQIQRELTQLLLESGGEVIGYKLGLTSRPMQELLGVAEPDFGPVLSSSTHASGATVDPSVLIAPRVEAELALILSEELRGPGVTREDVLPAVKGARAALEIIDSRIKDWKIRLVDTVADLASTSSVILGADVVSLSGWEPRLCGMVIHRNGSLEATGAGAATLGDPIAAVAWLANTLGPFGASLQPGHVVMTGSLHAAFPIVAGDSVRAEFDHIGSVEVKFSGGGG